MTSFGRIVVVASAGFLLAGIVLPGTAEILLRLYFLSLAAAFVATRAYGAAIPRRTTLDAYSPFTDEGVTRPPPEPPPGIRRRAALLRAADHPAQASRARIPVSVKWTLVDEASHRLAERRSLDLDDPDHHARIRSLVSDATWRLVRPLERGEGAGRRGPDRGPGPDPDGPPVTLDRLHSILDDLEKL